jgi:hypothetical protein
MVFHRDVVSGAVKMSRPCEMFLVGYRPGYATAEGTFVGRRSALRSTRSGQERGPSHCSRGATADSPAGVPSATNHGNHVGPVISAAS